MQDETKQPQSDTDPANARAYDSAGNVRPADARFLGDGDGELNEQARAERRQAELDAGNERVRKQYEAMNADEPNPTIVGEPGPEVTGLAGDAPGRVDRYDALDRRQLQAEAAGRDDVSATGSADDLRARLRADDAK